MPINRKSSPICFRYTIILIVLLLSAISTTLAAFGENGAENEGYKQMKQNLSDSKTRDADEIIDSKDDC